MLNSSCLLAGYLLFSRQSLDHHINYEKIEKPFNFLMKLKTPPIQFRKTTGTAFNVFLFIFLRNLSRKLYLPLAWFHHDTFTVYTIDFPRKLYYVNVSSKKCYSTLYTYVLYTYITLYTRSVFFGPPNGQFGLKNFYQGIISWLHL